MTVTPRQVPGLQTATGGSGAADAASVFLPWLGVAIGLLAGAYPAWKASAIEPIVALHAGQ